MATIELDPQVVAAAQSEADRRGVDVRVVITEAIQRFVTGADLTRLLAEFDTEDQSRPDPLSDADALSIAAEELATVRAARTAGNT
ncbi:MAG: hypothetical protein AB7V43_08725 [Acidimicrobiia bacterium]